jgi:hypothetical protein
VKRRPQGRRRTLRELARTSFAVHAADVLTRTSPYAFRVDAEALRFCEAIAAEMMRLFSMTREEAVGRLNRHWTGVGFKMRGIDLRYHEDPTFWANDIVYGSTSRWWLDPPGMRPRPYP